MYRGESKKKKKKLKHEKKSSTRSFLTQSGGPQETILYLRLA